MDSLPSPLDFEDELPSGAAMFAARLWRRRVFVLAATLLAAGLAFVWTMMVEPLYRAEATLSLANPSGQPVEARELAGQLQLIASRSTARVVVDRFDLAERPGFGRETDGLLRRILIGIGMAGNDLSPGERAIDRLLDRLSVEAGPGRTNVRLGFVASDPRLAADVVNAFLAGYTDMQPPASSSAAATARGTTIRVIATAREPEVAYFPKVLPSVGLASALALLLACLAGLLMPGRGDRVTDDAAADQAPPAEATLLSVAIEGRDGEPAPAPTRRERRRLRFRDRLNGIDEGEDGEGADSAPPAPPALPEVVASSELHALLLADGRSRIAVVGVSPDAGSRAIEALSRQAVADDAHVVVIDTGATDGKTPGLADLLLGAVEFGAIIRCNPMTRAHEISAGSQPLALALDRREALETMLEALQHTYDLVLMDLGRLRADDVLMAFIGLAERIVLVGSPDDDALRTAADLLGRYGFGNVVLSADPGRADAGAVA